VSIERNIDLRNMDWPINILNCKKEVDQMKKGEQMIVLVKEIDVVTNLVALIEQLPDHSIKKQKEKTHYKLVIAKQL